MVFFSYQMTLNVNIHNGIRPLGNKIDKEGVFILTFKKCLYYSKILCESFSFK